jgi:hypothetical protein
MAAPKFGGRQIAQTRMWPDIIAMAAVDFDEYARLSAIAKPFHVETFVAELAGEALIVAVLPRLAGFNQGGIDRGGEPFQEGQALARELVDDAQVFELLAVGAGIVNEILGLLLIGSLRRQWARP